MLRDFTVEDYIERNLTHEIHTSERMSRRGCRRRHDWVFRQMYYPYITAKPLEFGTAYHKGMEALYDPDNRKDGNPGTYIALAKMAFKNKCEEQRRTFIANNPGDYSPEVDEDYKERVELGLGMLNYWATQVMPKYDRGFTPLKVEQSFQVPIRSPQGDILWCKCYHCWGRYLRWTTSEEGQKLDDNRSFMIWRGLPVTYGGRFDLLAEDTNGDYWVVDWKTTSRMTNAEPNVADEFMLLDDQITSYCWALWTLGIKIRGFIYVEIRKAYPKEPEPNKNQRLGRWYSVNKNQDTSYEVYRRTVEENDTAAYLAGLYDEFLDYLKLNRDEGYFVHRHQIIRNETELRNAGLYIWQEAKEMIDPDMATYPSPGRFACNFCAFREPCITKNRGEDYGYLMDTLYEKRDRHYWETAESTTDKRYD